jgi:nucleoside-diphosphate-sugar epimerase
MKVFITGINGFIASHLSVYCRDQGYQVWGSTSRKLEPPDRQSPPGKIYYHKLGEGFEGSMFAGMDVVVHCAHDFQKGALRRNIEGTLALAEAAKNHRVSKQIFVSSLSARPDAQTEYGKTKCAIEQYFKKNNFIIVRPGTVLGSGGIFAGMVGMMRRFPVIPLLDGGNSQMYTIGIDDLCRSFYHIMKATIITGEYNLYYPQRVTLKEILIALRSQLKRKIIFIPVPSKLLIFPLSFLDRIGIKLPVDIDNLRGFMKSQAMPYPSDLQKVIDTYLPMKDLLETNFNEKV